MGNPTPRQPLTARRPRTGAPRLARWVPPALIRYRWVPGQWGPTDQTYAGTGTERNVTRSAAASTSTSPRGPCSPTARLPSTVG